MKIVLRIFICLFVAVPSTFAAVNVPPESERWTRLAVDNVTIYSNAGDRATRGTAESLIRFRDTLSKVMNVGMRSPLPTYVYVFQNESNFAPYREAIAGDKSKDVLGMFFQYAGANWILMQGKSDYAFDRVVYHELTHYLIRNNIAGVPVWLDEGLAGFYETFAPMGMSDKVTIGKPPYKFHDALLSSGLIPLRKLFAYKRAHTHKPSPDEDQLYLQSWFLLHYLLIGNPQRGAGLGNYLNLVADGQPMEKAFETAFGAKMETVDEELAGYLHRERFNVIQYSIPPSATAIGTPAPMSREETLYALGKMLARIAPGAGAEAFLAEAVKINPDNAGATAYLAVVKDALGKGVEAERLYQRAVKLGAKDPEPYVQAALYYVAALQHSARDGEEVTAEQAQGVRDTIDHALTIQPDNALANAILGASYTFAGQDAKKGIAASSKAFELSPAMTDVAADLVLLYARSGRPQLAKAMMERFVIPSGDTALIEEATENLALADYQHATELLHAHQGAEARMLLRKAREETKNEKLKAKIAEAEKKAGE